MAHPISAVERQETSPEQRKEETLNQLLSALAENPEGLQQTVKLLQQLHESGILPAVQALLEAKEQAASVVVEQLRRPPVTNMINNAMAAAGALGAIEPATTEKLMSGLSNGLKKAEEGLDKNETTGVWSLMTAVKDPDINRALTFGLNLLKGLGQGLNK
jgi:uncharacterized protein YjgD (DUF1641 family)